MWDRRARLRLAALGPAVLAAIAANASAPRAAANAAPDLFANDATIALRLDAPLQQLFEQSKDDPETTVAGSIAYADESGGETVDDVEISVRGNTSRREDECTFPKLKLRLKHPPHRGVFEGVETVKIGTHCGDADDDSLTRKYGRLANEHSPLREAFVYRLLAVMHVPSLAARPARITYVDGDSTTERHALLLEDLDAAVRRLGGTHELPPGRFRDARDDLAPADAASIAFAEAMIGNFDWCLKFYPEDRYRCDARHPLWNVAAVAGGGPTPTPLIYDFDLAGMVTGRHRWFHETFGAGLDESASEAVTEVTAQVQRARSLFPRPELEAARARFLSRRQAAFEALAAADVDAAGKQHIADYLNAFFDAIAADAAFYRPVVVRPETAAYSDRAGRQLACGTSSVIPVGTPGSDPLATAGPLVRVRLLDAFWHWAPPAPCPAIHDPIWINRAAVDTNYP